MYKPISHFIHLMFLGVEFFPWNSWKSVLLYSDITKPFISPFYRCRTETVLFNRLAESRTAVLCQMKEKQEWENPDHCSGRSLAPCLRASLLAAVASEQKLTPASAWQFLEYAVLSQPQMFEPSGTGNRCVLMLLEMSVIHPAGRGLKLGNKSWPSELYGLL